MTYEPAKEEDGLKDQGVQDLRSVSGRSLTYDPPKKDDGFHLDDGWVGYHSPR